MADSWTQGDEGRGILFGSLALQLDLLDAAQFIDACESWHAARQVSLAEWIAQRGRLLPDGRQEIERVLARKIARFRGDQRAATRDLVSGNLQRTLRAVRNPELGPALAGLTGTSDERIIAQRHTDRWGEPVAELPDRQGQEFDGEEAGSGWYAWVRRHRALVNWTVSVALVAVLCVAAGVALLNDNNNNQKLVGQAPGPFLRAEDLPIIGPDGEDLREIVRGLYLTLGRKETVLEHLKDDKALADSARNVTLRLAENNFVNSKLLNNASWYLVRQPGLDAASYERALALAEEACRLAPGNGNWLNTLGVAQYRRGDYAKALKTLQRSEPINANSPEWRGPHPADLAFLAMAHFRLGHKDQSLVQLQKLRQALNDPLWNFSSEARALLHETEELLEVPVTNFKSSPRSKLRVLPPGGVFQ